MTMRRRIIMLLIMMCVLTQQCWTAGAQDDVYTREELADDVMGTYEYITQEFSLPMSERIVFDDKGQSQYKMRIMQVYLAGFMNGVDEKLFAPDQKVTNAQVMTVIYRLIVKLNQKYDTVWTKNTSVDHEKLSGLPDWSKEAVTYLLERGIISLEDESYYEAEASSGDVDAILDQIRGRYNTAYSGQRIDFNEFLERSGNTAANIESSVINDSGSYIVKYNDYLYYYKYFADHADLCRVDLRNGSEEYVDTLTHADTGYSGVARIFRIDGRLYYSKSTDKGDSFAVYSIDANYPAPRFEGNINELIYAYSDDLSIYDEFKIFGLDGEIYVLARRSVYKLNGDVSERMAENVSDICVDGDKIYYSLFEDDINTGGIMCYDMDDMTNTETVSDEEVREYNKTTVYGDGCTIQNIFVDEDVLYFIGAPDAAEILKYNADGNEGVQGLTNKAYTRLFKKQDDTLYYIDSNHEVCCINTDGTDMKKIIENEFVFSFNVYGDKLYYYRIVDNSGYPAGLIEIDMQSGEKTLIARFK